VLSIPKEIIFIFSVKWLKHAWAELFSIEGQPFSWIYVKPNNDLWFKTLASRTDVFFSQ
jgi:hypothetical protein